MSSWQWLCILVFPLSPAILQLVFSTLQVLSLHLCDLICETGMTAPSGRMMEGLNESVDGKPPPEQLLPSRWFSSSHLLSPWPPRSAEPTLQTLIKGRSWDLEVLSGLSWGTEQIRTELGAWALLSLPPCGGLSWPSRCPPTHLAQRPDDPAPMGIAVGAHLGLAGFEDPDTVPTSLPRRVNSLLSQVGVSQLWRPAGPRVVVPPEIPKASPWAPLLARINPFSAFFFFFFSFSPNIPFLGGKKEEEKLKNTIIVTLAHSDTLRENTHTHTHSEFFWKLTILLIHTGRASKDKCQGNSQWFSG